MASANQFNDALDALADLNRKLVELYLSRSTAQGPLNQVLMQTNMNDANRFFEHALEQPNSLLEQQIKWWQQQLQLSQHAVLRMFGQPSEPVITPDRSDRRFTSDEWQQNVMFDYLKQSYLLTTKNILDSINQLETLDEETRKRLEFFTRQYLSAASPSNYLLSNPELLKATIDDNGQNLVKGMTLFVEDMEKSADTLNIRMTDQSSFRPGENIAVTPGKVIFRNALFELIQYTPTTSEVLQRPLLIVPPFINKYYILDLQAQNSFVRWAVAQGHTVFMMSWVNATPEHNQINFEDYVVDGVLAALDAIEIATGEKEVNGIGYCIGGTLLSITMAYLATRRMKQRIRTGTLFTTLLDFAKPGDIGVFINEESVSALETQNKIKGYMDGRQIAASFSLLRENSLYWNYFVDNYLKGKSPMAFDLLYWNCDSTNVPGACHSFLLRECYLENKLITPGGISIRGTAIDLSKIKLPLYFLSAAEDHIALWDATYDGAK
ncbi:MAG: class I poly(R)-hydroxyalkanoic acid synthase, partial [Plesiomonas sp.]